MNKVEFPRLGELYYEEKLPSGMILRIIPKRGFAKKYAVLGVDFGSIDTSFTLEGRKYQMPQGIAHYLEHKMFDLPEGSAMDLFSEYGGYPNAFTSYALTAYYFSCTENFEENLKLLLRMVLTPYFTEESVEKERGIIGQEIQMYDDDSYSEVSNALYMDLFASHPVRNPIAGTVESIGEITAQTLYDCYNAFYQPANMVLCIMGDVDIAGTEKIVRALTPTAARPVPVRDYGAPEEMTCCRPRSKKNMSISMPTFYLGFKCENPGRGDGLMRRSIIGNLAAELLCGESSSLYKELYEGNLIDSGISAGFENVKDACMLSVNGDSRDPEAVYAAVIREAEKVRRDGFEKGQFRRLWKSCLGRRIRGLDRPENVCTRNCEYYLEGSEYFRFPEIFDTVTEEDVREMIAEVVCPQRAAMAVIVPKEENL